MARKKEMVASFASPPPADEKKEPFVARSSSNDSFQTPFAGPPAVAVPEPSWGTGRRLQHQFSKLEQDHLEEMVDRATRMASSPRFIPRFHPQASWLWGQWNGTVLQQTWKPAAAMMAVSLLVVVYMEPIRQHGDHRWTLLEVPHQDDLAIRPMRGFTTMWGYLLTMCTFVNSFFLSQAYGFWLANKGNARKVQGQRCLIWKPPLPNTTSMEGAWLTGRGQQGRCS